MRLIPSNRRSVHRSLVSPPNKFRTTFDTNRTGTNRCACDRRFSFCEFRDSLIFDHHPKLRPILRYQRNRHLQPERFLSFPLLLPPFRLSRLLLPLPLLRFLLPSQFPPLQLPLQLPFPSLQLPLQLPFPSLLPFRFEVPTVSRIPFLAALFFLLPKLPILLQFVPSFPRFSSFSSCSCFCFFCFCFYSSCSCSFSVSFLPRVTRPLHGTTQPLSYVWNPIHL